MGLFWWRDRAERERKLKMQEMEDNIKHLANRVQELIFKINKFSKSGALYDLQ